METSGCHAAFYYCCFEHLLINMSKYITEALRKNELVLLSVDNPLYHNLLFSLEEIGIREQDLELYSFSRLVRKYRQTGLADCRNMMVELEQGALEKGFSGINWIVQPGQLARQKYNEDMLVMQKKLVDIIGQTRICVLFIYDINNYLEGVQGEEERLIEDSLQNIPYILSEFTIKKTKDVF